MTTSPESRIASASGARVARARRERGMTQRDLARSLRVTTWTVDRIEDGAADVTPYLPLIAEVTQREAQWFLNGERAVAFAVDDAQANTSAERNAKAALNLVLGSIVLLVTIRFFTETIPVIPRAANFVDIPIFLSLAAAAALLPTRTSERSVYLRIGLPTTLFLALAVCSTLVNVSRTAPAPVVVFIYGFLSPIILYVSVYSLWPPGRSRALSKLLIALGLVQLAVVGLINVPRFLLSGYNPDLISGTFGTNSYQLVFFLLVIATLVAGIFTLEPGRAVARFAPWLFVGIFGAILLAQYRALLVSTLIAIVVVAIILGRRSRGLAIATASLVAFGGAFVYIASQFPTLKLDRTASTLTDNPLSYARERARIAGILSDLYSDESLAPLAGTGPGTFSSRAWQTFANAGSTSVSNVQGDYALALTGGAYETDVSTKYIRPRQREALIVEGSRAVSSPFSSYLSVSAEVGLFGLALLVGLYVAALSRVTRVTLLLVRRASTGDSLPSLALATTIAFLTLLQMAFLENWLEVTRLTFVAWAMFAIVLKEYDARSQTST